MFIPQKHKEGLRIKYNSGFFIATNVYPDFGKEEDCVTIRKRLEVFQSSSLPRKDGSATGNFLQYDYSDAASSSNRSYCIDL